jgi:CRP-like cAMP-binding protein
VSKLLRYLSGEDERRLLAAAKRLAFDRGDVIVAEGSPNQVLYFLRSGRLAVEREHLGKRVRIAFMHPGEQFEEMSFLDQSAASASVVADERVEVDAVDGAAIQRLIESIPGFATGFYHSLAVALADRLRERTSQVAAFQAWG